MVIVNSGSPVRASSRGRAETLGAVLEAASQRHMRCHALRCLCELVAIPSVSGEPSDRDALDRAARWLIDHLRGIGLHRVELVSASARHPFSVYGEWREAPDAPTLLLYSHYDVQPAGPRGDWHYPPFEPTVRGGWIHGRGASDDKGQLFTHLSAIQAWLGTTGRLPLNVKVWIEGAEEIGSPGLERLMRRLGRRLDADAAVISDTQMVAPGRPTIVYGQRGLVVAELVVTGGVADAHDGRFGGAAPNPIHELAHIVDGLHDSTGRVALPKFYDRVRLIGLREREALRCHAESDSDLARLLGVLHRGDPGWSAAERIMVRPTLNVTGIDTGRVGGRSRSAILARAAAQINVRLVPDQHPLTVADALRRHVRMLTREPHTSRLNIIADADPVRLDLPRALVEAAQRAVVATFGIPAAFLRSGGTIPVVAALQRRRMPVLMIGFGLPGDRVHAANEQFSLTGLWRGTETMIRLFAELQR
jgi:acetylornithine deacetylase/succinyl-diaminopimelate desuccinylase-like protein